MTILLGNETFPHFPLLILFRIGFSDKYFNRCVCKMLNGHECMSSFLTRNDPFNQTALDFALKVLNRFYFVGIFEEYEKSLMILHQLVNDGHVAHQVRA